MGKWRVGTRGLVALAALLGAMTWGASHAAATRPHGAALKAPELVATLHQINLMEIDAGTMARSRGATRDVREFGTMLARDHAESDRLLATIAAEDKLDLNGPIPAEVRRSLDRAMTELDNLANVTGTRFDRRFARAMLDDHRDAIEMLQAATPGIDETKLRGFLLDLVPTLRAHERAAAHILGPSAGV
jgi:putative membrane protein